MRGSSGGRRTGHSRSGRPSIRWSHVTLVTLVTLARRLTRSFNKERAKGLKAPNVSAINGMFPQWLAWQISWYLLCLVVTRESKAEWSEGVRVSGAGVATEISMTREKDICRDVRTVFLGRLLHAHAILETT